MTGPTLFLLDAYLGGCALLENVSEVPPGSNDGPQVRAIQAVTGNTKGDPWCASAKAYVGDRIMGKRWPLPRTGSCNALAVFAIEQGVFRCTAATYADMAKHGLHDAAGKQLIAPADVRHAVGSEADIIGAPERGDVCLLYSLPSHHFHHAGAVRLASLPANALRFGTWEGNTTKPGAAGNEREGWGYFAKDHALADPWGWVRWVHLTDLLERANRATP